MSTTTHGATRTLASPLPIDLRATLGPLWHGRPDPTMRLATDHAQRGVRTPEGPAAVDIRVSGTTVALDAYGPGATWLLDRAPALVGATDDLVGFVPQHRAVGRAARRRPGLRIAASGTVWDVLVPTILAQKVTGKEAAHAWLRLIHRWGEPAPGPLGLSLPPAPEVLATLPIWDMHAAGIEEKRAATIRRAAARHDRLQAIAGMATRDAYERLTAVAGIGPWTAALVIRTVNGDPDPVEVGDFHIKNHVSWNLAGEPRGDDARMLELLEPYRGHRGRVVRLLVAGAPRAPAHGPRHAIRDIRDL